MQEKFGEGSLAEACVWQIVVLIPKGYVKDLLRIDLVGVLCKATTGIVNWRLTVSIKYYNSLHGFWA